MKVKVKLAAILSVLLILAMFPLGAGAAHYYGCNRAQFVMDVTVPDGSHYAPGDTFTKTWRVRNVGTCTWTPADYSLVLTNGNSFGIDPTQHLLTAPVPPWSYVDLTLPVMTAPATPGKVFSYWKLDNGSGEQFGVGWSGGVPIFALINVVTPPSVTFDFTAEADSAIWTSGVPGSIPFPGTPGASEGSASSLATPKFENGVTATNPGLLVTPNNAYNGFIEGYFSTSYTVKKGDRFQTTVGCEFDQTSCYVAFSLKYQIGSGPVYTLWTFRERYEGLTYSANINLDRLTGKNVNFILSMSAYGSPVGDRAIWGHPVIVGTGTPGGSSGGSTIGWSTFHNTTVPFSFKFPPGSNVDSANEQVSLPFPTGTNLEAKFLKITTSTVGTGACLSSIPNPGTPDSVTINGIGFNKETGMGGADDHVQKWVAYSAKDPKDSTCVSMEFELGLAPGLPPVNEGAESAVFDTIMSTFEWK